MALLTDPLTGSDEALVEIVARGYGLAQGRWPVWQWVRWQLQRAGHDPDQTIRNMRQWQFNYRPIAVVSAGGAPR